MSPDGSPLPPSGLPRVLQVALGSGHACAILEGGKVKCWGHNNNGQLGLGDEEDRGDAAGEMGAALPAVDLGPGRTAKELALMEKTSCALLDNGTVKCWGNVFPVTGEDLYIGIAPGEMGPALAPLMLPASVKHLAAGYQHLCAIFADDTTRCWGGPNDFGQLGVGDKVSRTSASTLEGVSLGTGRIAKSIHPSTTHTCALLDDGSVKCWGDNGFGELGLENTTMRLSPGPAVKLGTGRKAIALAVSAQPIFASLPAAYNCAILDDGSLKCWGYDSAGLGIGSIPNTYEHRGDEPGEMGDALASVNLGTGKKAAGISIGMSLSPYATMSCALLVGGSVKCWGYNSFGSLGVGDTAPRGYTLATMGDALAPIDLGPGVTATAVVVSSGYALELSACAIVGDGQLKCWGGNKYGQLGIGDTNLRGKASAEMASLPYVDLGI